MRQCIEVPKVARKKKILLDFSSFTGKIEKLTVRLGRLQLAEDDIKAMHASLLAAKD
jgi:hypothetical protein